MAKNIIATLFVFWITVGFNTVEPSDLRDSVRKTYYSQIGIRELTGRNDGKQVESYLKSVNRKKGDAWCAAFISWNLQQCKIPNVKSGWSPSWFPKTHTIYIRGKYQKQSPQHGDVFGLYFVEMKRIAHVGFIDKWGESWVTTVEGNTSDANSGNATREGQGVYKKKRIKRQIYAVSSWIN